VAEVADALTAYRQEGLEYLTCGFVADSLRDFLRQVRVFAEEVAPQLSDAG
jgi:hypothetical protein